MSDEEIEGEAHKRSVLTGKDEGRVRGGFKAMRKQIQENKGIGAAVRQHHSGAESIRYDDAQHIASMSDEEIEAEAHERADMNAKKDEQRIRGGLKAMRTLLNKSQGGNLGQKQGDENNTGKSKEASDTKPESIPLEELKDMSEKQIENEARERAEKTGANENFIRAGLEGRKTRAEDDTGSGQGGNHAGEKRSHEEAENRASKKQNVEQKERHTNLPPQETAPVV